ncbi:BZ3500_MvSof-1268-A1-R1_Chr2-1g04575 [Microbotryum saponariae]|uniref:BZ3500_MvSof-1268-A1-R1_Chr2-1g04575 protein n=1 Tax=Microbotryum saponariae TaxID=289078 RepID=A0A2X0K6V0_9BASI|nr:BZ3500_MvSof-1268-A1-R1_Chr2-1g04575 [Microbotryum saponariae]SCZ92062.1 BZ3501_MvSof-1269-A2-R1_Chr2-1g04231 [Microbotryum saponariae]
MGVPLLLSKTTAGAAHSLLRPPHALGTHSRQIVVRADGSAFATRSFSSMKVFASRATFSTSTAPWPSLRYSLSNAGNAALSRRPFFSRYAWGTVAATSPNRSASTLRHAPRFFERAIPHVTKCRRSNPCTLHHEPNSRPKDDRWRCRFRFRTRGAHANSDRRPISLDFDTRHKTERWFKYLHRMDRLRHRRRKPHHLSHAPKTSIVNRHKPWKHFSTGLIYFSTTTGPQRGPRPTRKINLKFMARGHLDQPRPLMTAFLTVEKTPLPPSAVYIARPTGISPGSFFHSFRGLLPQAPSILPPTASLVRMFTTSRRAHELPVDPLQAREAGFPLLLPLATLLKSSAALHTLNIVSRVALTILPFSVRAKYFGSRNAAVAGANVAAATSSWASRIMSSSGATGSFGTRYLAPLLAAIPIMLLGGIVLASLEQTPITGRWRMVMLSPAEEAELISSVLGTSEDSNVQKRDWVGILRSVLELEDEGVSPTTGRRILLGGEVLDERDWRVRWADAVLRALEHGVPSLGIGSLELDSAASEDPTLLQAPPTRYPLRPRSSPESASDMGWLGHLFLGKHANQSQEDAPDASLNVGYDLIVIDRAEANAFSFGFAPEIASGSASSDRRGVIVVYAGFIDQILGSNAPSQEQQPPAPAPRSSLSSYFTSKSPEPTLPNLVPTTLPTREQTQAMAVLLSHELSHLLLSHSMELQASTSLLLKHVSKLAVDVIRTITFPLVAMLGPFLSDAIHSSTKVGVSTSWNYVGSAMLACQSRALETEADLVALRLLACSGIDPRFALKFWEGRVERDRQGEAERKGMTMKGGQKVQMHSPASGTATSEGKRKEEGDPTASKTKTTAACWIMDSHPVEEERVERIRKELAKWERYRDEQAFVNGRREQKKV